MPDQTASLEFHNAHLDPREGGTWQLSRYPAPVRHALNERGRMVTMDACGVEIRFVTPAKNIRVTLTAEDADTDVQVYCGAFLHLTQRLTRGIPTAITLTPPERFPEATDAALASGGWSPDVWRIAPGRAAFLFHHLETFGHPVRPPTPAEKPAINWLAYGSSITHSHHAGYPYHAARLLHWNLWGKGLSGACHIEKEAADYLAATAAQIKASIITAELGVNMRGDYTVETFAERAAYLLKTLRSQNPGTPIVLITAFTNSAHYARAPRADFDRQHGFDAALRDLVARTRASGDTHVHLIEGTELLTDFTLLSADVLHPTPSGHALMGHNLADRLRTLAG
ncbi:GDSL-type esterase/lipase family protein [Geminisphaera colitermitum]|uniref:GDSL-type esterase/lipase family protein n=1 Tax=Geminisphaera colitermitum TaxID=1148786 RepID=UPI0001965095|nr:GDSL-type esterase/lipase family protein [Geminisphaera colitermitum]